MGQDKDMKTYYLLMKRRMQREILEFKKKLEVARESCNLREEEAYSQKIIGLEIDLKEIEALT